MAHHQHHGDSRRGSAIQSLLNLLKLSSNTPTIVPNGDDDTIADADEPPDDQIAPLRIRPISNEQHYPKSPARPNHSRRESLLTQAIRASSNPADHSPSYLSSPNVPRGFSTTSSHSAASMTSTAELTSDGNLTSPPHSATPSPPLPQTYLPTTYGKSDPVTPLSHLAVPTTNLPESRPTSESITGEAAVEKTLGRKRCIMFACGKPDEKPKTTPAVKAAEPAEPPKRRCMLTFACPTRRSQQRDLASEILDSRSGSDSQARKSSTDSVAVGVDTQQASSPLQAKEKPDVAHLEAKPVRAFREFPSSNNEPDAWVEQPIDANRRLTLTDCLRKENAIRRLGEEAEAEADEEEHDQEDREDDNEASQDDDFAPSDNTSDAGNESDDEGGFADSDDESDAESEYRFWAPSTTTAATSTDNISITHISNRQRSAASSLDSNPHVSRQWATDSRRIPGHRRSSKTHKMRPGTPELPDSTDFVCGTLDEDRPLEAAFIACREQRKREKHIPIPQDIDPSFPTTDPENDDNDGEEEQNTDEDDVKLSGIDEHAFNGRHKSLAPRQIDLQSPPERSPSPKTKPEVSRRMIHRSPPPTRRTARSPPPRRLFGHSPTGLRSPPLHTRLRSPRGSPTARGIPLGMVSNRLAQRPALGRTSSVPHTPNPFFKNYQLKSNRSSRLASGTTTPGGEADENTQEMHVRGPVDIIAGLEKKRQKRKEKAWRQQCRKTAAKEQADRRRLAGRGAERMRDLGLECAERTKGYGTGQPAQHVISL